MTKITRDQLYAAFYHFDSESVVGFLKWLATSYGLSGRLSVLDLGCGPGRVLGPLADCGWQVTGCDPDRDYTVAVRMGFS